MDSKRIEEIYDRLPKLIVDLDPDPVSRGHLYLQDQISKVRGYLNEVSVYLQEVIRVKGALESELEALTCAFEINSDELLANNEDVRALPSLQDRRARINVLLREERAVILGQQQEVNGIGHVEKAVRHRHRELEQTMSAIRLQRSLIESDRKTGALYGDESNNSRGDSWQGVAPDIGDDAEMEGVDQLLKEALGSSDLETLPQTSPSPASSSLVIEIEETQAGINPDAGSEEDPDVAGFLDSADGGVAESEDLDLDSLLEGL
jgi:hypothetical protein